MGATRSKPKSPQNTQRGAQTSRTANVTKIGACSKFHYNLSLHSNVFYWSDRVSFHYHGSIGLSRNRSWYAWQRQIACRHQLLIWIKYGICFAAIYCTVLPRQCATSSLCWHLLVTFEADQAVVLQTHKAPTIA